MTNTRGFAMVLRVVAAVVLALCSFTPSVLAQQQVEAPALVLTPSVRSVGMGFSGAADDTDPMNTFLNPATLAALDGLYGAGFIGEALGNVASDLVFGGFDAGFGYQLKLNDTTHLGAAAQLRMGILDYGDSTVVDTTGQAPSDPQEDYTGATIGLNLRKGGLNVGAGFTAKRWGQDFGFQKTSGVWAYDVGLLISHTLVQETKVTTIAFGISAVNLGDDFTTADSTRSLPKAINYGVTACIGGPYKQFLSATVPELQVVMNVDYSDFQDSPGAFRLGGEISVLQAAFLRVGWQKMESSDVHEINFGLGLGVPLKHLRARVDYAVNPVFRIKNDEEEQLDHHDHKVMAFAVIPL
jgi:hypothetical protein